MALTTNLAIIFGQCGKTTYFRIMLVVAIQFEYYKSQQHFVYYFLKQCTNCLNEEIGEMMLADLAKNLTFNPQKHNYETIVWQFVQRRKLRNLATDQNIHKLRKYCILDEVKDTERVNKTNTFLYQFIHVMKGWKEQYPFSEWTRFH